MSLILHVTAIQGGCFFSYEKTEAETHLVPALGNLRTSIQFFEN